MLKHINTIIVGGGQAGLSTSYYLKKQGWDHVIFEKSDQAANVWRNRWDSFTLITPNWMTRLPGAPYSGDNPDGFMGKEDVIQYFEDYIAKFQLPIRCGITVESATYLGDGYLLKTTDGNFRASNLVIATGLHQKPKIPAFSKDLSVGLISYIPASTKILSHYVQARYLWWDQHNRAVRLQRSSIRVGGRSIFL